MVDTLCWFLLHKLGDPVYSLGGYAWCLWICFAGSSIINLLISFTKLVTPFTIRVDAVGFWPWWIFFVGCHFTNVMTPFILWVGTLCWFLIH